MKNAVEYIKANKTRIIKTLIVAAATVTTITLVGYIASRNADVVEIELEA